MLIHYDSIQEGDWFRSLHPRLVSASLLPFPANATNHRLSKVLAYDRPDIVLVDNDMPILVLERTREVPSGHNVGQRFARLVAAAQSRIPTVYFGPYKAYKHGHDTAGPRYMNLRLFHAIRQMSEVERTAITVINWPVDTKCELIQTPDKDRRVRDYLRLFFDLYDRSGLEITNRELRVSDFEADQERERKAFIEVDVRKPEQYNGPPASVSLGLAAQLLPRATPTQLISFTPAILLYTVGMNYIRSDPYTGTAMLYAYLYCGGMTSRSRSLVLYWPGISKDQWLKVSRSDRKDIRLFRLVADAILFKDGLRLKNQL